MMLRSVLLAAAVAVPASLSAATTTFLPVADGNTISDDSAMLGVRIDADSVRVGLEESASQGANRAFLEYDLGALPRRARLTDGRITLSNVRADADPVDPIEFGPDIISLSASAYEGDGIVDDDDIMQFGSSFDITGIPVIGSSNGGRGAEALCTVCALTIEDLSVIEGLLAATDRLTVVLQIADPADRRFNFFSFDSVESSTGPGAVLTLDFATIPVPASGITLLSALGAATAFRRRR